MMKINMSNNESNDPVRQVSAFVVVDNQAFIGQNHIPYLDTDNPVWKNRAAVRILVTHAEVDAIRCALDNGVTDFSGAVLYTSLEPCSQCRDLAQSLGIRQIYFCHEYIPSDSGVKNDNPTTTVVSRLPK
jgi:tRNA(Arg) A34 adenosine deaminase TadA